VVSVDLRSQYSACGENERRCEPVFRIRLGRIGRTSLITASEFTLGVPARVFSPSDIWRRVVY